MLTPDVKPLPLGAPRIDMVIRVYSSATFRQMQNYSNVYLEKNDSQLGGYRWIKDALNQWSRIYEYPFCFTHLASASKPRARVLDAGSGVTFFPFMLDAHFDVACLDRDDYASVYCAINQAQGTQVQFTQAALQEMPFESEALDAVYCLSVLEHTREYPYIIEEFERVLKPGGILIVTFDISLDHNPEGIEPQQAVELVEEITRHFDCGFRPEDLLSDLDAEDLYTSEYANQWQEDLLPWPKATPLLRLRNILRRNRKPVQFRDRIRMTFCNLAARKPTG